MAYCANCGIIYPPDKRFCKECGSPLGADPSGIPQAMGDNPVQCPACGWNVPAGDRFCPQCGTPVVPSAAFDVMRPMGTSSPRPQDSPTSTGSVPGVTQTDFSSVPTPVPPPPASDTTQRFTRQEIIPPQPPTTPIEEVPMASGATQQFTEQEIPAPPSAPPETPFDVESTQRMTQQDLFAPPQVSAPPRPPEEIMRSMAQPTGEEAVPIEETRIAEPIPAISETARFQVPVERMGTPAAKQKSHVGILVVAAVIVVGLIGGSLMVWQRIKVKRETAQLAQQTQAAPPAVPSPAPTQPPAPSIDEKTRDTMGKMNAILMAIETFKTVKKKLPTSLNELGKIMEDPQVKSDSWGNPLIYLVDLTNDTFVLRSAGPDGKRDTEDDIRVSDDTLARWREQHHEVLDEWRIANLELFQKLSGEQITSETNLALERKRAEREKARADAAAQRAAQLAAQRQQEEELRKQRELAAQLAEQQRLQEEARRRAEEERLQRERAEAERKARLEKMNFVENFDFNLHRWTATSFQAVTEKGRPAMRIVGFGLLRDAGDWDNYTVLFDVKIQKEGVNFIIRARDRQNFYFLKLTDDKAKNVPKNSLIKYIYSGGRYVDAGTSGEAPGAKSLVTLPMKIKQNETLHLAISVSGNTIRTSINGQLVDTWQDNTFKQGAFGFNCSDQEQAVVTSFQMRSN